MKRDIHIFWTLAIFFSFFFESSRRRLCCCCAVALGRGRRLFTPRRRRRRSSDIIRWNLTNSAFSTQAASTSFLLKIYLFWYVSCTFWSLAISIYYRHNQRIISLFFFLTARNSVYRSPHTLYFFVWVLISFFSSAATAWHYKFSFHMQSCICHRRH